MISDAARPDLVDGVYFYREGAAIVFTEGYHLRRGYCCESGCRHCPYGFAKEARGDGEAASDEDES